MDEHVASSSEDEIGLLANAFNSMADNLTRQEKLRKQLVADIAHELRTPLTSIRSYVEAFQDGVLPADSDNLAAINEEIDRLVGLVSDLKDLNIAEMGALTVFLHPVDLVTIIDKVIHNLSPLIRTDRSRTRETGGSGIGLALVKQIVVLHQGNISVESKMGEGSVFTVTLPKPAYS